MELLIGGPVGVLPGGRPHHNLGQYLLTLITAQLQFLESEELQLRVIGVLPQDELLHIQA